MSDRSELARVKRAASARRRAEDQYRAALVAAAGAGVSYAELARAAGTTRQAVRQLVERSRSR